MYREQFRPFWLSGIAGLLKGGTRPVLDFQGDVDGTARGGSSQTLEDTGAFGAVDLTGGTVFVFDGTGGGQMRSIASHDADTLTLASDWTTAPDDTSMYVAVAPCGEDCSSISMLKYLAMSVGLPTESR